MRRLLLSGLLLSACTAILFLPPVSTAYGEQVSFSFWRNLVRDSQVLSQLEYQETLAPLSAEAARQCCAVRPGQKVSLVRGGEVVACGQVGQIFAATVPRAGDDRIVFFDVTGIPDTVGVSIGLPPFPKWRDSMYDLYVVGRVSVEEYKPPSAPWRKSTDLVEVAAEAIANRMIDRLSFMELLGDPRNRLDSLNPEAVAAVLLSEANLVEFSVSVAGGQVLTVQSVHRQYGN